MRSLFFILIVLHLCARSQSLQDPVFTLKPSVGLNVCQIHGDAYDGYNKPGAFFGIAVNGKINSRLSMELGFYFSQKGARHNPNVDKGDYSYYRLNLNYLDMPLLLRYMVNPKYFITIGPSIAYLISYNENINYVNMTGMYKFNKTEVGVNFGLGRKIKEKFYVEVRTSNSVTPIRSYGVVANLVFFPNPVARFFNKGFYNNILTLLVSYKLDARKKNGVK